MIFDDLKTCFEKRRDKRPVIDGILILDELLHLCRDERQLISGSKTGNVFLFISRMHLILERGNTHHVEFIEVRRCDAQELDPLKKRNDIAVSRLGKATSVELQPGKFPVPVVLRISEIHRILQSRRILRLLRLFYGGFLSGYLGLRLRCGFSLCLYRRGR